MMAALALKRRRVPDFGKPSLNRRPKTACEPYALGPEARRAC